MRIAEISIRRPVFALMLILGLVVLGLVSMGRIQMQLDPDTDHPYVTVTTELRGASPQTVESEVTQVIEEYANSVDGVRLLASRSSEGVSRVSVQFRIGADPVEKMQEVREKVGLALPFLPPDVELPVISRYNVDDLPFLTVLLGGRVALRDVSDVAEHVVSDRLERLPGVGAVTIVGGREREIRIWVDPVRLSGYGLSIEDVADMLRRENAELAGGRIEGSAREWSVTTQGKVRRPEDFGSLIVAQRDQSLVHLRDVAVVEDGLAERQSLARMNGAPAVALEVRGQSGSNIVEVARAVREEVGEIAKVLPADMEIRLAKDAAVFIEESVHAVVVDMCLAGILVFAVVLFFLRNIRSTLVAWVAIPASLISSFTFFYAAGFTMNSMTLIALSLSIGLVVDDAIVVLESIYRKIEAGEPAMQAAERGSSEVGLAVVSTTLAICGVFVPIAFMEGMVGVYFYEFGMVVVFTVAISTLVALSLTPMLASRYLRALPNPNRVFRLFGRIVQGTEAYYRRILGAALRRKGATVGLALAAIAGGCAVASTIPVDFYVQADGGEFMIDVKLPIGTTLSVTDEAMRRAEEVLKQHPEVRAVFAKAGSTYRHTPHVASLYVAATPKDEREQSAEEIFAEFRSALAAAVPEADQISVGYYDPWIGEGMDAKEIDYSLRGPDLARLEGYAAALTARMREDPAFVDVGTSFESGKPQISLDIQRARAADLGVPAVTVGRTIRTLLAGEKVGSFEELGRRHDVRVQVLPEYRDDPSRLDLIRVRSVRGELVPLGNVVDARVGEGPVEIERENRARTIRVSANMAEGVALGEGVEKFEVWGRELGIAPPDELAPGVYARAMRESNEAMTFAFLLALVAIYMILASLFNSLVHPLTIMMSAPLSFIGGFLALKLSGLHMEMMSGIGLLVLMGLVMKNGILLVDYTNELRRRGRSREEAILEAGPIRMRPVLMTSGALIFGMVPAVVSTGAGSEFRDPMAMITIGGLLTSTLLTLVVVPVVYSLLDEATLRLRRAAVAVLPWLRRRLPLRAPRQA